MARSVARRRTRSTRSRRSLRVRRGRRVVLSRRGALRLARNYLRPYMNHRRLRGHGWYGYIPTSFSDLAEIPGHIGTALSNRRVQAGIAGVGTMAALGAAAFYGYVPAAAVGAAHAVIQGTNAHPYLNQIPAVRRARHVANTVIHNIAAGRRRRRRLVAGPGFAGAGFIPPPVPRP